MSERIILAYAYAVIAGSLVGAIALVVMTVVRVGHIVW